MSSFLDPLLRTDGSAFALANSRTNLVLADALMTAFDSETRRQGLLGRDSMPANSAMIIAPSNAIHTFFMRFAIDVAFVSRNGRVLKIRHAVPPWRMAAALRGYAVIELPPGALERAEVRKGDTLSIIAIARPPAAAG
jgi:uncharacterized membrane protein (UPF0127 family)